MKNAYVTFDLKTGIHLLDNSLFLYFSIFFLPLIPSQSEPPLSETYITILRVCWNGQNRKILAEFHKSTAGGCRKLKICVPPYTLPLSFSISIFLSPQFYLFRFLYFFALTFFSLFLFLSLRPTSMLVNEIAKVTFTGFPVRCRAKRVSLAFYTDPTT